MGGTRIDLEARTAIVKALRKGTLPSVVARKFAISRSSVVQIGREAGIVRPPLSDAQKHGQRKATEASRLEARRRRNELSLALLADAEKLRQQLWQPAIAFDFGGGGENYGYHEHQLKQPDARAKRDLVIALAVLIDKHIAIERLEDEASTGIVKGAIVALVDRLEAAELTTQVHVVDP